MTASSGASFEERRERFCRPYGDDAGVVDPHALEELADQLAALDRVGFGLPEPAEVLQHRAGAVEVGGRAGRHAVECVVDLGALGPVLGLLDVAHFVEVAEPLAALLQGAARLGLTPG
ncbi:hypothetical protein [Baekduia sp.]|uniref:hypothetical protein n=1 Tax=Baekduia sp. TaxID=2600305 RepID=UPI002DF7C3E2|nr:hypothetical protein [Baekduia sp.]